MSDFDKEAEREKLRDKYEQDREEREATERMSDLLLKGATMTNAHCGTCGDPVFRHEGQEFCPTCQEVLREDGEPVEGTEDDETPTDAGDGQTPTDAGDGRTPADAENGETPDVADGDRRTDPGTAASNATAAGDGSQPAPSSSGSQSGPSPDPQTAPSVDPGTDRTATDRPAAGRDATRESSDVSTRSATDVSGVPETAPAGANGLADARDALSATVTELAASARGSDDLERTRAYLAAVEEAADALAAVKRADR